MKTISKIALGVALMMPFGAFAAVSGNAVTSKGYVDSGLSQKANRADGGVGEIAVITTGGDYEGTGVAISDLATTASLAGCN